MLALPVSAHTPPRLALPHLGTLYETEEGGSPTSDRDGGGTHLTMHLNPAGYPHPSRLNPPAWPPTNLDTPSPCCCPAEGHHPQDAWGPRALGPHPPALTSPPAGPVRRTPGPGVRLGSTPRSAQTKTMWVGATGPLLHPGQGPAWTRHHPGALAPPTPVPGARSVARGPARTAVPDRFAPDAKRGSEPRETCTLGLTPPRLWLRPLSAMTPPTAQTTL